MLIKVKDASRFQIDYLVAQIEGALAPLGNVHLIGKQLFIGIGGDLGELGQWVQYSPTTDGAQCMAIIMREGIDTFHMQKEPPVWEAEVQYAPCKRSHARGTDPMIAAMKAYVLSTVANESAEVPDALA